MLEYEREMPNGLWIAKRGYCYYLYYSLEDIKRDDYEVSCNLDRIRNGNEVFNRCYDGLWIFYSRKLRETKEYALFMQ